MKLIGYRSHESQWGELFSISKKEDVVNKVPNPKTYDLVSEYGQLSIADVKIKVQTFIGKPLCMAQDDNMLFTCLMASITDAARVRIQVFEHEFKINKTYSGICFLRTLIRESQIDNMASERILLSKFTDLDEYMNAVGHDIEKFNHHVRTTLDSLASRGSKPPHDLLHSLFKGYLSAKDKTFTGYIQSKRNQYNEGDTSITADHLMQLASAKYKALVQTNDWQSPTAQDTELLALKAQLSKQERTIKELTSGAKKDSRSSKSKKDKSKQAAHKAKKSAKNSLRPATKHAAWKYEKPLPHMLHKPVEDERGQKFWWCSKETGGKCHGVYRMHEPSDCKGPTYRPNTKKAAKGKSSYKGSKSKAHKKKNILKALTAAVNDIPSNSSSDVEMDSASE